MKIVTDVGRVSILPAAGAVHELAPRFHAHLCGSHVLLKHKELPLAFGQDHYFLVHVLGREVQSPLIFQSRNPFPSPHLQVQVLMNVPVH